MKILLLFLLTCAAQALTVDELVARNLEARGGVDKIKAIRSLRLVGTLVVGGDESPLTLAYRLLAKPGMVRTEATLQGLTAITACDGQEAWRLSPFGGRRDPEKLPADQLRELRREADLEGPLVDWRRKGHKLTYLGLHEADGTRAHKLRIERQDGLIETLFLDPEFFLEIRSLLVSKRRGTETLEETDFGNYEKVAGVFIPFATETGTPGGPKRSKITITGAEANVDLEDSLFRFPR